MQAMNLTIRFLLEMVSLAGQLLIEFVLFGLVTWALGPRVPRGPG